MASCVQSCAAELPRSLAADRAEKSSAWQVGRICEIMASPHDAPARYLLMLTVYLDESGHETPTHVVIAGFVGNDEQWKEFAPEWMRAVGPSGSLHMKDLRWERDSTRQRLARLGPIPHQFGLHPVIGAVNVSDFSDLLSDPVTQYALPGYIAALHPIMIDLLRFTPPGERIKFVFDQQEQYQPIVEVLFSGFNDAGDAERISDVSFVRRDSTCLTQPSDYLAYATLQRLRDPHSERAAWCSPILGNGTFLGRIIDRETIRAAMEKVIPQAEELTFHQTGISPEQFAEKYPDKKAVRELMKRNRTNPE